MVSQREYYILALPCFEWRLITKSEGVPLDFDTSWAKKAECHDPYKPWL